MFLKALVLKLFKNESSEKSQDQGSCEKFHGFYDDLVQNIQKSEGPYKDITRFCPPLFKLLCSILNDRYTDWNTKLMIDAALAYFVLPDDIIPDPRMAGYVDDLFIVCHVLKQIKDSLSPEVLTNNWSGEEDILFLVDSLHQQASEIIGDQEIEILRKVGLHKYQSLELGEYSGTYPQRLAKLGTEKRELLGLLAYLIRHIYKTSIRGWNTDNIKSLLQQYGDYDEIERLIELSKRDHQYIPKEHKLPKKKKKKAVFAEIDQELKAARMKALIDSEASE